MARLIYNGLTSALDSDLSDSATAIVFNAALSHSGGLPVPTISGGNHIPLTILSATGTVSEIVRLTAYTAGATTGTITRGQEGTTAVAHSTGDRVVNSATVADFDAKANLASPTFTGTVSGITKTMVGLDNVDNTADSAKPVSTAQAAAIATAIANLINSAPGALDTLDELAAALGDDSNFAATITASLADKVAKSLYDANTILAATTDDTPAALAIAASRVVGRKATGDISALTAAELWAILAGGAGHPEVIVIAVSDETTAITTGTAKVTFRMPFAFTLSSVRASLTTASTSGIPAIDLNEAGASVFSTTLTIDATEKTSVTAATAAVVSDPNLADDAEMTVDIDTAGTGAKGLKIYLIGTRA